jgi:hypothetical protein
MSITQGPVHIRIVYPRGYGLTANPDAVADPERPGCISSIGADGACNSWHPGL